MVQNGNYYKEFYGCLLDQIPKLLAEDRTPMSIKTLVRKRIESLYSLLGDSCSDWWNNNLYVGDNILYHPNGNVKVVLAEQFWNGFEEKNNYLGCLVSGSEKDTLEVYESLEGIEFRRKDLEGVVGRMLSKKGAKNNPIWNALVPDRSLLKEYIDAVFALNKHRLDFFDAMGVLIAPTDLCTDHVEMRLWLVKGLHDLSCIAGTGDLIDEGRLIGVAKS